jgi:preprotein translocase subunit SecA
MEDDLLRIFGGDRIGPLMDRLGLGEGEAIEHAMLTGAIRRAQKRVEGRNFDIRKRLLEFDLVLARQRDAIYAVRDRFLLPPREKAEEMAPSLEADLDEYLEQLFDEIADNLVAAYAGPTDEFNTRGLAQELSFYGPINESDLADQSSADLIQIVREHLDDAVTRQKERLGKPFPLLARFIILHTIDEAWRTHLYTLDDLKGGIGWTAFGGTDPVIAFKRESFKLFQEMLARAAETTCKSLLNPRLTISGQPAPAESQQDVQYVHPSSTAPTVTSTAAPRQGRPAGRRVDKEPGRNDPCPCGSGKKYKRCCGAP